MSSNDKRSCKVKGIVFESVPWNWMRGSMVLMMALGIFLAMPSMEVEADDYEDTIDNVTYVFSGDKATIWSISADVKNLTIPASVTHPTVGGQIYTVTGDLDSTTFSDCANNLETLTIHADVDLNSYALEMCKQLTTITVTGSGSIGEQLCMWKGIGLGYNDNTTLKTVSITGGNEIKKGAFRNCTELTNLTLKNTTITRADADAFLNCPKLTNLILDGVTLTAVRNVIKLMFLKRFPISEMIWRSFFLK